MRKLIFAAGYSEMIIEKGYFANIVFGTNSQIMDRHGKRTCAEREDYYEKRSDL